MRIKTKRIENSTLATVAFGFILFRLIILSGEQVCLGQKLLPDTSFIRFNPDTLIKINNISIREVIDNRDENSRFVQYGTKKKYLLFPVDQEIYTQLPLAAEIIKEIPHTEIYVKQYRLEIDKFLIEKRKGLFSSSLFLVADIQVYEFVKDSTAYLGTFFYDYLYRREAKKEAPNQSAENLLSKWHTIFKLDLMALDSDIQLSAGKEYKNFISATATKSLFLNSATGVFGGLNWWGIQGELYFSRPEIRSKNRYTGGIIRYINNEDYESFAIGKMAEHFVFRNNKKWLVDIDFNVLFGFCKWKDIEINKPKLYQILDMEVSSSQSFSWNEMNKTGITFKAGLIENFSYVIEKKPKLQIGLILGAGFSF